MKKMLMVAGVFLALVLDGAAAAPIVFTNAQYDTTAVALTNGGMADVNSAASPSPLPLVSTATVVGPNDFASSVGLAADGLLVTSAEADSFAGAAGASAVAQAHLVGSFLGGGPLILYFDFDSITSAIGGGTAAGTLFVTVTNTLGSSTTTLFNDLFAVGANDITLELFSAGGMNTIDLLLFSEAASTGAGQAAQNFAQVTFSGTIPLPSSILLVIAAMAAMLIARNRAAGV
ncbi:hypothetical protein [Piscinibacter koreensis]|uniref:Secreted protein n=1 Tax=Piscinibacter koreensis TaxID=2742824 RepID=A0A7Y6TYS6_9BURK|nr:hypothetical protein [Schlegelella koreensis]NUZ08376.1 hypothetical protein [Schlegelella koreensis]